MLITNFASGELSPNLEGRVDIQQYYQSAGRIENFNVNPTGGIRRRKGFHRVGELSGECRLIPFILNKETNYIFECVPGYIYVWKNGEKVMDEAEQVKLPVPYTTMADIRELQYCQFYNSIIITHQKYKPMMIELSGDTFTVTTDGMEFNFLPEVVLDDDYDYVVIMTGETMDEPTHDPVPVYPATGGKPYPDGLYAIFKGNIYKWNVSTFTWEDIDEDPDYDDGLFTDATKRPSCCTFFNGRLYFASTLAKRQTIWASAAPDTKGTRYADFSTYKKYVTVTKVAKDPDMHVFSGSIAAGTRTITNVTQDFTQAGVLSGNITDYYITSDSFPRGTKVVSCTGNTITLDHASINTESRTGAACTISLWKNSEAPDAGDYYHQVVSTNVVTADCSFNLEIASEENDAIKWLSCNRYLVAGTETAVWCLPSGISALAIQAEMSGKYGSDDIQALCIDTATVFFAQGKLGIREFYYNAESQAFTTNNIALMADELIAESPAVDFDYVTNPYNRLFITRADGKAVSLLYDRNNGIMAWTRISHASGLLKSCCSTRGEKQSDVTWWAVEEEGNWYLEKLDDEEAVYLDGYTLYQDGMTTDDTQTLWNETSGKSCKGDAIPDDFIADGDVVYVGKAYQSVIVSMPVIASDPMSQKRIVSLTVRFHKSSMPVLKVADLPEEYFSQITEDEYSGAVKVNYPGNYERDVRFEICADGCKDVNILCVNAQIA